MNETESSRCNGAHFQRRELLRVGALSFLGIGLTPYLELKQLIATPNGADKKAKAQACILLWLNGGPSHIDTWDPKANSSFKPISTNVDGIQIAELLPRVARKMDKLAMIRCMQTEENNHLQGHHYAMTGHRPNPVMKFPSFGSIISKELGARHSVPPHIKILGTDPGYDIRYHENLKAQFLGAAYDPMILPNPSAKDFAIPDLSIPESVTLERIENRSYFLKLVDRLYRQEVESAEYSQMDSFRQQALNMILSPAVREGFDLSKESEKTKDAYGRDPFGQSVLLARRLVEAGCRFVTATDLRGWDTHGSSDERHGDLLVPVLDQVLSTLLGDLEQRGLLESTLVIVMGEFGRTVDPIVRKGQGRDHWCHCWSMVLGGGGIRGGQAVGASDERGAYPAGRTVSIGDLYATIYKAMGIDWTKEYMHPIGRPLKIANAIHDETGVPIAGLV